jgi:hypothetical protein
MAFKIISLQNGKLMFEPIQAEIVDDQIVFVLEGREDENLHCPTAIAKLVIE